MPDQTEERGAQWYRERLPDVDELLELLGDDPAATLLNAARTRAVADGTIDVSAMGDDPAAVALVATAGEVVKKLSSVSGSVSLTPQERDVLDAVVLIVARPALFVREGKVLQAPPNWRAVESDHALIEANLRGIGCVAQGDVVGGTAVLVERRHAITNNHVVCWLLGRSPHFFLNDYAAYTAEVAKLNADWAVKPELAPELDFLGEFGNEARRRVRLARVAGTHAKADLAVLEIAAPVAEARIVPLQPTEPSTLTTRPVYVVGFPVIDVSRATPLFILEKVFGGGQTLSTKRVSPGYLRGLRAELSLVHDASTLNGSSGSAVFDFETHEMVALHHAGSYDAKANFAVPMWTLAGDALLKEHGIRYSGV